MDLSKITNVIELKAMAYDELAKKQQAEQNLNMLNQRIAQLNIPKKIKKNKNRQQLKLLLLRSCGYAFIIRASN